MDMKEKLVELILSTDLRLSYSRKSDALNIADHLIANGVTLDNQVASSKWISVKDRLPEDDSDVLAYLRIGEEGRIYPAHYKANKEGHEHNPDFEGEDSCPNFGFKRNTNADRIRAMSDEEMAASHLIIPCFYDDDGYGECKYGWHNREQTCEECKLEWLRQPAKL